MEWPQMERRAFLFEWLKLQDVLHTRLLSPSQGSLDPSVYFCIHIRHLKGISKPDGLIWKIRTSVSWKYINPHSESAKTPEYGNLMLPEKKKIAWFKKRNELEHQNRTEAVISCAE